MRFRIWIFYGFIACGALFFAVYNLLSFPSDESLVRKFESEKPRMEILIKMIQQDYELRGINLYTGEINGFLPDDRASEYRDILKRISMFSLFTVSRVKEDYDAFHFKVPAGTVLEMKAPHELKGSVFSSTSEKGFAYFEFEPRGSIESNLNGYNFYRGPKSVSAYRQISGKWYLYYSYEP